MPRYYIWREHRNSTPQARLIDEVLYAKGPDNFQSSPGRRYIPEVFDCPTFTADNAELALVDFRFSEVRWDLLSEIKRKFERLERELRFSRSY